MNRLRRHVLAVVAALFALAVGIALGGGPLSYVPDDDTDDTAADTGGSAPEEEVAETPEAEPVSGGAAFADAFAAVAAPRLYSKELFGHPTAIVTMPGVEPEVVEAMVGHVAAAGGGLTGVFEVSADAVDRDKTSEVDLRTAQLMTQLGDARIDPEASTYTRLGQLLSVGIATPVKRGQRHSVSSDAIRIGLSGAGLLTSDLEARLAPLVLVLLPADEDLDAEEELAQTAIYTGLTTGVQENAAGAVALGDTASGDGGLLARLREDPAVTSTVATVDGGDTVLGQVTAMLAVIGALDGSVGAYGASGSDGAVPLT